MRILGHRLSFLVLKKKEPFQSETYTNTWHKTLILNELKFGKLFFWEKIGMKETASGGQ